MGGWDGEDYYCGACGMGGGGGVRFGKWKEEMGGGGTGTGKERERGGEDELLGEPEPRRMAGRPVDWMLDIMDDGGAVPVVVTSWDAREKLVDWIPNPPPQKNFLPRKPGDLIHGKPNSVFFLKKKKRATVSPNSHNLRRKKKQGGKRGNSLRPRKSPPPPKRRGRWDCCLPGKPSNRPRISPTQDSQLRGTEKVAS